SRSLGIVMIVSTHSRSASSPRSACSSRFLPSNLNGLVTTATVSAPSSLARLAMTGAAPVPVPPPRPVVTKIISAPSSACRILSVSSSAESFGQLAPNLQLDRCRVVSERLQIGIGNHELHAVEADANHAVDGIAA